MCGRVVQAFRAFSLCLPYACLCPRAGQGPLRTTSRRVWELYVIRKNHKTDERTLDATLPVTFLIRADEFCIGQPMAFHRKLDFVFCRPL